MHSPGCAFFIVVRRIKVRKEKTVQLGNKLRYIRYCLNLSQKDMGKIIGAERSLLSKYETGVAAPAPMNCLRIARKFDIALEDLIDEEYSVDYFAVKYTDCHFF